MEKTKKHSHIPPSHLLYDSFGSLKNKSKLESPAGLWQQENSFQQLLKKHCNSILHLKTHNQIQEALSICAMLQYSSMGLTWRKDKQGLISSFSSHKASADSQLHSHCFH